MSFEQSGGVCKTCNNRTLWQRQSTNHILHLLLSVITVGFWLPIWFLNCIRIGGWRCTACGAKQGGGVIVIVAIVALAIIAYFVLHPQH